MSLRLSEHLDKGSYNYLKAKDKKYLEYFLNWMDEMLDKYIESSNKELETIRSILLTIQMALLAGVLTFYGFGKFPKSINENDVCYISALLIVAIFLCYTYHIIAYLHSVLRYRNHEKQRSLFKRGQLTYQKVGDELLPLYFFRWGMKVNYDNILTFIYAPSAILTVMALAYILYLFGLAVSSIFLLILTMIMTIVFFSSYFKKT